MLNTILEYRKGILFVRLDGHLVSSNIKFISSALIPIIERDNLENIVLNMESVSEIDLKGIHFIFYLYEMCKKNKGILKNSFTFLYPKYVQQEPSLLDTFGQLNIFIFLYFFISIYC